MSSAKSARTFGYISLPMRRARSARSFNSGAWLKSTFRTNALSAAGLLIETVASFCVCEEAHALKKPTKTNDPMLAARRRSLSFILVALCTGATNDGAFRGSSLLSRIHAVETNPHSDPLPSTKGEGNLRRHRVRVTDQRPEKSAF